MENFEHTVWPELARLGREIAGLTQRDEHQERRLLGLEAAERAQRLAFQGVSSRLADHGRRLDALTSSRASSAEWLKALLANPKVAVFGWAAAIGLATGNLTLNELLAYLK